MWLLGVGFAFLPIAHGVHCLRTGHARFCGDNDSKLDLQGSAAIALAVAFLAVGVFIHAHWFWGLHPRLEPFSGLLKVITALVFLGSFSCADVLDDPMTIREIPPFTRRKIPPSYQGRQPPPPK